MSEIRAAGYSPTIKKRALSRRLVELRKQVGLTTTEVCKRLRWSPSKLNYIEKAKWIEPNCEAVADLCELYGVEGNDRDALIRLAREARERGWWSRYSDVFRNEYPGFEAAASIIRTYQHTFLPGLLQARSYLEALPPIVGIDDPAEIKRHVDARLARQEILLRTDHPCGLHAVIDENAILRMVDPKIRQPQLRHLVAMSELPNVDIQLVPTSSGLYRGAGEPFTYLGFSDPGERDIVLLETSVDDRMLEEKDELRRYMVRFDRLCEVALDPEATRAHLREGIG
ncbi:helix-turn-helix domain-containing protein [Spirillospora sp. NBC_01491]|uniref:helix-turn-helix domain-containing protein n=1 Tax=Spirillospora sp. NBC_01491 TaxID=2976007 RepID=UPI002E370460|nr:helix-turn-helix transcriptional regulator [Spirillospora sp. NBC_01491]